MMVQIEHVTKSYGMKTLFKDITFSVEETDHLGVVGINGTGKSTLLKIIAGIESADEGKISQPKNTVVEYLSQSPEFDSEATVIEQVLKGDSEIFALLRAYESVVKKAEASPDNPDYHAQLMTYTEAMNRANGWDLESQVKTILTKLKIPEFDKKIGTLSGGQKKRVALAASLIVPCDILILDEPTNHLDSEIIDWLEQFLGKRKGSLIMVTHDRYFLDRVCNRILEISHGKAYSYEGNYTYYVTAKAERLELANVLEQRTQNIYRRELAWIRSGAKARSTKQKARINRFEALKSVEFITKQAEVDIAVGFTRMGKKTIILDNLSKGFDGNVLFSHVSHTFLPTDRLGIVGPNGAGKTTLLNIVAGRLCQDKGQVEVGDTIKIGYFSQEASDMDIQLRCIDYIKETAEYVETESGFRISASQMMDKFLIEGEMQYAPIYSLSGGERRRLYLLKTLMEAPNVLILDEPTNDLDIDTLKILEAYIDDYKGIVITVSHDRYFLNRVCNLVMGFEGKEVIIYRGSYEDYSDYAKSQIVHEPEALVTKKAIEQEDSEEVVYEKLSYKEQQALSELPEKIEKMMAALEEHQVRLNHHQSDFTKLQELTEAIDQLENDLMEQMEYQERLETKLKLFEANKNKNKS